MIYSSTQAHDCRPKVQALNQRRGEEELKSRQYQTQDDDELDFELEVAGLDDAKPERNTIEVEELPRQHGQVVKSRWDEYIDTEEDVRVS